MIQLQEDGIGHVTFITAALWGCRVPCCIQIIIPQEPILLIILRKTNKIHGSDLLPTMV